MKKFNFKHTRLVDLASQHQTRNRQNATDKLDLVIQLDYLGYLTIESKYLQSSTIPWLIGQVKLLETDKRIPACHIEISVDKNSLCAFKPVRSDNQQRTEFINHKLTSVFKLCRLVNDQNFFAYFYKQIGSTLYTLHTFYSTRSNLVKCISDLQMQAIRIHESLNSYEKTFDFEVIGRVENLNKVKLDTPNFIEGILAEKAKTYSSSHEQGYLSKKRLIIKFKPEGVHLEETDRKSVEKAYSSIVYLNNSVINENYFCLAYSHANDAYRATALVLYAPNVELIDSVIREYAVNVSSELSLASEASSIKLNSHTCSQCPMQQFCEFCEYLNLFDSNPKRIYEVLVDVLERSLTLSDQNYFFECLSERRLSLEEANKIGLNDAIFYTVHTNQLIVALLHKLCRMKQNQHLILNLRCKRDGAAIDENSPFTNQKLSLMSHISKSKSSHLIPTSSSIQNNRRRNTIDSEFSNKPSSLTNKLKFIDLFQAKNPFRINTNINMTRSTSSFDNFQQQKQQRQNFLSTSNKSYIRCSIFHKIVGIPNNDDTTTTKNYHDPSFNKFFKRFKSTQDIRQFWKKLISEQILLNKMEAENRLLQLKANLNQTTIDYSYPEITIDLTQVSNQWDEWIAVDTNINTIPNSEILAALCKGVPQAKRGQVWMWLAKRNSKNQNHKSNVAYTDLLKQSTIHQHSILLDLARTFPTHPNFSKKLGSGQLALFNVLKAYSIVDPEVGYCQGLSFIVGILLIHVNNSEEKAFEMLKFLLIDLNLREQYRPDMKALQKYMYQFSRVLCTKHPDIYTHLDENEITASLYAAPWFLTLFSSTFQIGFVARVFDFLFHQGLHVLFTISLSVLVTHKPILLMCSSFESIVEHLKTVIPEMSLIESELIMSRSFNFDLSEDLKRFQAEFDFISEEYQCFPIPNENNQVPQASLDYVKNIEIDNKILKEQLVKQADRVKMNQLLMDNQEEAMLKLYHENKQLKCQVDTLRIERQVLLRKLQDKPEDKFCDE